jgi:hypothetical protein
VAANPSAMDSRLKPTAATTLEQRMLMQSRIAPTENRADGAHMKLA